MHAKHNRIRLDEDFATRSRRANDPKPSPRFGWYEIAAYASVIVGAFAAGWSLI